MKFKNFEWQIILRIILLLVNISAIAYLFINGFYIFVVIFFGILAFQITEFFRFHKKAYEEISQFVESVHYRDFSRNFDVKHAPKELQPLRQGFNDINSTFKIISKEKETQYQYLQKILELVGTGILSYNIETGEVIWMNDSIKKMLHLPYLKTIHSLAKRDEQLYQTILDLKPGISKIASIHIDSRTFKVLLSVTHFQTEGTIFKLLAFQNVDEALDETESKAWAKLLRVMTHEIMNSIAPISSLADTIGNNLKESRLSLNDSNVVIDDIELGIETIKKRSEGLLKFAETYRNLNKITTPNIAKVYVRDLFESLHHLMQPTLEQKNIDLQIVLKDTTLAVQVDVNLIEQVLINLLVNSIEAIKDSEDPKIILSGYIDPNQKTILKIADNGIGMSEEVIEKIFIPFFSTKKSGSGIGLSLCKQILMLHHGNIQVHSVEGKGTTFLLSF